MKARVDRGLGLVVDEATSRRLARVRQRDTSPEQLVRTMLRAEGIRYGTSSRRLPGSPDIVNLTGAWCVFVHGCFWHAHRGCPRATKPRRNREFWVAKFESNRRRDARVARELRRMGYRVLVVWECDVERRPARVATRLRRLLRGEVPRAETIARRPDGTRP